MLTPQQTEAAKRIALGASASKVAAKLGVSMRTVFNWKGDPEFQTLVAQHQKEWRDEARSQGIADQYTRLHFLNDRHRKLRKLMKDRGASQEYVGVPGGDTGILTKKTVKDGTDFVVDTAMLSEFRQLEMQIAVELGQWKTRSVVETDSDDENMSKTLAELFTAEEIKEMIAKFDAGVAAAKAKAAAEQLALPAAEQLQLPAPEPAA